MQLFDAHAHLAAPDFADDLSDVVARAESAGVCGVVTVGETLADAERILDLAARHPLIKPAAGLFPTILDPAAAADILALIRRNADRLVALGEVGLDRWMVKTEAEWRVQEAILAEFVAVANELDLPLNVHSRSAGRHAIIRLFQKFGFMEEVRRRKAMHRDGEFWDVIGFGLLNGEWRESIQARG